jgi:hypothetical protein
MTSDEGKTLQLVRLPPGAPVTHRRALVRGGAALTDMTPNEAKPARN